MEEEKKVSPDDKLAAEKARADRAEEKLRKSIGRGPGSASLTEMSGERGKKAYDPAEDTKRPEHTKLKKAREEAQNKYAANKGAKS